MTCESQAVITNETLLRKLLKNGAMQWLGNRVWQFEIIYPTGLSDTVNLIVNGLVLSL